FQSSSADSPKARHFRCWHVCDIARLRMDFRFRWKSGRAADITPMAEVDPKAILTGSILPALNRAKLLQRSSVLGRRHARGSPGRAGEARLRGKLAIEGDLRERCTSRRDHRLGALQPPPAEVAMRRHAHGGGKCPGEMKDAQTRDIGEVGDADVFSEMLFDVCEHTPQPSVVQPMSRW